MNKNVLLLDFGSTYTKATLVNLMKEKIIGQGMVKTRSETNLLDSYKELQQKLSHQLKLEELVVDQTLICSSAFGGFKMVVIGLSDSLTAAAAKNVALGAGTRIIKTYTYQLSPKDVKEIEKLKPDVILLTGGTDGGNSQFILNSAKQLTQLAKLIPIIVAGNYQALPKIKKIFTNTLYYESENVMPKTNLLKADQTREILRNIFFEKIIYAKGLGEIAKLSDQPIIPTPTAVLSAANLLAHGTTDCKGWGDLMIVDVGGATTDVHSVASRTVIEPTVLYEGLPEPLLKRTVEGDLGMRYSAMSLYETASAAYFERYNEESYHKQALLNYCRMCETVPFFIAQTKEEIAFDQVIAKIAIDLSVERHVGSFRREKKPGHDSVYQHGKDLRKLARLIGTGGALINSLEPGEILTSALQTHSEVLKPQKPRLYLDRSYLLSALGLLGEHYPHTALKMMKSYLTPI